LGVSLGTIEGLEVSHKTNEGLGVSHITTRERRTMSRIGLASTLRVNGKNTLHISRWTCALGALNEKIHDYL